MTSMVDITVPDDSQEGTTMKVQSWLKQPGDSVTKDEPLVEMETDKVVVEIASPAAGVLDEILVAVGTDVSAGMLLGHVNTSTKPSSSPKAPLGKPEATPDSSEPHDRARPTPRNKALSPAVKRFVLTNDIDVTALVGSGTNGRITLKDVKAFAASGSQRANGSTAPSSSTAASPAPAPTPTAPSSTRTPAPDKSHMVPHTPMRRAIAEHMSSSVAVAPHVTAVFEVDFSAIIAHRAAHKSDYADKGVKLTFTAYFLMACVRAMHAVPEVNSQWHDDGLELFSNINIGVGTALGNDGLIVPVVKNMQEKNLFGAATALQDMTERARNNSLRPDDVQGGTFTISNHGVSGSLVASPIIINQPQSAILGVGKLEKRVVVRTVGDEDVLAVKPMAYVSLTIDHRALDGHQTNAWLSELVATIEGWPT